MICINGSSRSARHTSTPGSIDAHTWSSTKKNILGIRTADGNASLRSCGGCHERVLTRCSPLVKDLNMLPIAALFQIFKVPIQKLFYRNYVKKDVAKAIQRHNPEGTWDGCRRLAETEIRNNRCRRWIR